MDKKIIIAIDGPSASGKGTLGRNLAKKLGYDYMDTGALYRLIAKTMIDKGIDEKDTDKIIELATNIKNSFNISQLSNPELKTDTVGILTSKISVIPEVRNILTDIQSNFANHNTAKGAILDGRDIGTVICPHADIKLFITATTETRAARRTKELNEKNISASYEDVLKEMQERDKRDANRDISPMKPAHDAYIINTSYIDENEVMKKVLAVISNKLSKI